MIADDDYDVGDDDDFGDDDEASGFSDDDDNFDFKDDDDDAAGGTVYTGAIQSSNICFRVSTVSHCDDDDDDDDRE